MPGNKDFMRFMAMWALVHETADEGWKSAVRRGLSDEPGSMNGGPEAFVDGLSAMIADEKERLKAELAAGETDSAATSSELTGLLEELRFELAELRGRVESLQSSVDALADRDC